MTQHFPLSSEQDYAWLIVVPKRQEFTQPKFHFGERVKWCTEAKSSSWGCQTGRIIGVHFIASHGWTYLINLDQEGKAPDAASGEQSIAEQFLQLVKDSASLRRQLKPAADWLLTNQAAARLGLSLPWQSPQDSLSPGLVAQAFASILVAIGTPAPKPRGKSPRRATGYQPSARPRYPTVKKRASKRKKSEQSPNQSDRRC